MSTVYLKHASGVINNGRENSSSIDFSRWVYVRPGDLCRGGHGGWEVLWKAPRGPLPDPLAGERGCLRGWRGETLLHADGKSGSQQCLWRVSGVQTQHGFGFVFIFLTSQVCGTSRRHVCIDLIIRNAWVDKPLIKSRTGRGCLTYTSYWLLSGAALTSIDLRPSSGACDCVCFFLSQILRFRMNHERSSPLCFWTSREQTIVTFIFPVSPAEVRCLWAQLRRDEPHLLSNFEDFLARVTSQIKVANQEKKEMESALKRSF